MIYLSIAVRLFINKVLTRWYNFREIAYLPLIDVIVKEYYDSGANAGYKRYSLSMRPWLENRYGPDRDFTYQEVRQAIYTMCFSRKNVLDEHQLFKLLRKRIKDKELIDRLTWQSVEESIPYYPQLLKPTRITVTDKLEEYL